MTMFLRFTLPLPPSVNSQYVTVGKRRMLSREARAYKRVVQKRLERLPYDTAAIDRFIEQVNTGYLAVFIDFYFETPLRRDLDGGLKIAQDAICAGLGVNDNRVVDIHLVKRIDPLNPRIEVELEALEDWQFDSEREVLSQPPQAEGT